MKNKIYELSDESFTNLVKSSLNISEVLFKLGYSIKGNSWGFAQVKRRMQDLQLDGGSFRGKAALKATQTGKKIKKENLLKTNCKHSRSVLRRYIISNKLLDYKCAICGISEWNGKTLSLEIDHINGINNDNRLENLRFLCPNCHSQTTTYGARNQQLNSSAKDIYIDNDLRKLIIASYKELSTYKKVSKKYGIRMDVVTKVLNEEGYGKNNQKYVIQYDVNHKEINRFGTIAEATKYLINNNIVKTRLYKTARNTLLRNINKFWNGSYFKILDANRIRHNLLVEPSLIDSEVETLKQNDEGQANAA